MPFTLLIRIKTIYLSFKFYLSHDFLHKGFIGFSKHGETFLIFLPSLRLTLALFLLFSQDTVIYLFMCVSPHLRLFLNVPK